MSDETYLRSGDDPPPPDRPVLALYKDPATGKEYRIRAVYLPYGLLEAAYAAEEVFNEDFWDWINEDPYWPCGWYEEAVSYKLILYPLEEGSVLAWREFPAFGVPESKEFYQ